MIRVFSLLLLCAAVFSVSAAGDIPANPIKAAPGMEVGQWSIEPWSNSGSVDKKNVLGQKLMEVLYSGGKQDKAAFKHITHFGLDPKGKIKLHVYSGDPKPPQVAIAVSTTVAFKWHESKWRDLKQGWNALEFEVGTSDWKSEASKWQFTTSISPINDIRAVDFIVFNGERTGTVYVQGWGYDTDETGKKVAEFVKDIQSEDAGKRELAEKALVAIGRPALEALQQIADDDRPEVLLRAASAIRQIEKVKEEKPSDPTLLEAIEKQKEAQGFDDARRRAEYTLRGIENERQRLQSLLKDAEIEAVQGRKHIADLKHTEEEKRKDFAATLDKIDTLLKDVAPVIKAATPPQEEMKK